jgi:hypothetical protein
MRWATQNILSTNTCGDPSFGISQICPAVSEAPRSRFVRRCRYGSTGLTDCRRFFSAASRSFHSMEPSGTVRSTTPRVSRWQRARVPLHSTQRIARSNVSDWSTSRTTSSRTSWMVCSDCLSRCVWTTRRTWWSHPFPPYCRPVSRASLPRWSRSGGQFVRYEPLSIVDPRTAVRLRWVISATLCKRRCPLAVNSPPGVDEIVMMGSQIRWSATAIWPSSSTPPSRHLPLGRKPSRYS